MLYRKHPRQAPKLLLRILTTAGAGGLLAISGCSSGPAGAGLASMSPATNPDASDRSDGSDGLVPDAGDSGVPLLTGSVTMLPDGGDGGFHVISGIVIPPPVDGGDLDDACDGVMPEDGGDGGQVLLGIAPNPDSGVIHGSVVMPPDAGDDAS